MKLHKIPNIPLDECAAEQKIAYNLAFAEWINRGDPTSTTDFEDAARYLVRVHWRGAGYNKRGRYNDEAILAALTAGLEGYLKSSHHIFSSYKEIGDAFPVKC